MKQLFGWIIILVILSSCVSRKKYTESQLAYERLKTNYESYEKIKADLEAANQLCEDKLGASERKLASVNTELEYEKIKVRTLEQQMEYFKSTNTNLLDRLADLGAAGERDLVETFVLRQRGTGPAVTRASPASRCAVRTIALA